MSVTQFLEYKQLLVDYLDRFLGDLVLATNEICQKIFLLEQAGVRDQFRLVARRASPMRWCEPWKWKKQETARWDWDVGMVCGDGFLVRRTDLHRRRF